MELKAFCTDLSLLDSPKDFIEGQMFLVDKPLNWTSFDIVKKMRSGLQNGLKIKKIKVGHAGTLDPLASGLVIVCTGKATKKIDDLMGYEKCYDACIKFGATTPSFDVETEIDQVLPFDHITQSDIEQALEQFLGEQLQMPPQYSAIKIEGRRAYDMARKGETFEMKSRKVFFHDLQLLDFTGGEAQIRIRCSKGTYIRSFARDLALALNSGGHLTGLRRTAIGPLEVDNAITIYAFDDMIDRLKVKWGERGVI